MPITYTINPRSPTGDAQVGPRKPVGKCSGQRSDLGFRLPSCGLIGVLRVWGFRVIGLWIRALGLGVEASGSSTSLPIPKVNCLTSKIVLSVFDQ